MPLRRLILSLVMAKLVFGASPVITITPDAPIAALPSTSSSQIGLNPPGSLPPVEYMYLPSNVPVLDYLNPNAKLEELQTELTFNILQKLERWFR